MIEDCRTVKEAAGLARSASKTNKFVAAQDKLNFFCNKHFDTNAVRIVIP